MKKKFKRAVKKLKKRIDKAEYKITDVLEVMHELVAIADTTDDQKQVMYDKLERRYEYDDPDDMVGDGTIIQLDEKELAELHSGAHIVTGGFKVQYVGDAA